VLSGAPTVAEAATGTPSGSAEARTPPIAFHPIDNPELICYSKSTDDLANVILVVVNLDPRNRQSGWTGLDLAALGVTAGAFEVHDLLTDARYRWSGARNYVELRPSELPAHVFRVRRRVHTERDFDYFA